MEKQLNTPHCLTHTMICAAVKTVREKLEQREAGVGEAAEGSDGQAGADARPGMVSGCCVCVCLLWAWLLCCVIGYCVSVLWLAVV